MILRRDRTHHHGKTNKDHKTIDSMQTQGSSKTMDHLSLLATAKSKKLSQILEAREKRIAAQPDPIELTRDTIKKDKWKDHHLIGYPRLAQLEEKELRKRVFCGESNTIFVEHREPTHQDAPIEERGKKERLVIDKREERATGIQETQLVGVDNRNTLEGKVDLEKVREIRRAIRRRYANRKNFQKIFNLWDEDSNGAISVKNLYNMIQRLSININIDEARVLLSSVDRNGSDDLGLDEFLDLIFNDKDALNVNLKNLPALTENEKESLFADGKNQETLKYLQEDAQKQRDMRHENQVNMILKNRVQQIATWLLQSDQQMKGYLSAMKFRQVINKLEIDKKFISDEDILHLYDKFKNTDDSIDYKAFINHLKQFQLQDEVQTTNPYEKHNAPLDKKHQMLQHMKLQEDQKINIYDITKMDAYQLEKTRSKAKRMFIKLQRYIPSHDKFKQLIKSKIDGQNITASELTMLMTNILSTVNEQYKHNDLESLLSIIQFGQYSAVPIEEVVRVFYQEDDGDFYDRVQLKRKGPSPPQVQINNLTILDTIDRPSTSPQVNNYYKVESGMSLYQPNINKELATVLIKVDNGLFNQSQGYYKLYNEFDKDKDGYVSQQDIKSKFEELNILNNQEIDILIKHIDPDNKGYATFAEFNHKIRNGMSILDQDGYQVVQVSSQPGKQSIEAAKQFIPEFQKQIETFKLPFRAQSLGRATRFSATPAPKNTFQHFVPPRQSPMYLPPEQRFNQCREEFQQQEKLKNSQYQEGKLQRIQHYQQQQSMRIQSAQDVHDRKQQNHLKSKAMAQWTYEHNAHLKNDYQ